MDAKKPGHFVSIQYIQQEGPSQESEKVAARSGDEHRTGNLVCFCPYIPRQGISLLCASPPSLKCRGEATTSSEPCHQKTLDSKMSKCSGGESNNGQMCSDLGRPCFKHKPGRGRWDNRVGSITESHSLQHWRQEEAVKESTGSREGAREMGMWGR